MNAEEKANELVEKFIQFVGCDCSQETYCNSPECQVEEIGTVCFQRTVEAKKCAVIVVEECLDVLNVFKTPESKILIDYFNEVKSFIENIY